MMKTLRPLLSSLLVAIYVALAAGMAGGMLTFWMWGFGALVTLPLGFASGAIVGWRWLLRDAVILFAACFSALAAANWIGFAIGSISHIIFLIQIALIFLSGLFSWFAQTQLSFAMRYRLALVLVASLIMNVVMVGAIRS